MLLWDNKRSTETRIIYSLDLLFKNFIDTGTFLDPSTERFLYEEFLVLWDNAISTDNRDTSPLFYL